jgi:hypothetical protein
VLISGWPRPLNGRLSERLVWDAPASATLGALQVRAVFTGGPGGVSKRAKVVVDERGLSADNATAAVGPGAVDLLTGNLAVTRDDASIARNGCARWARVPQDLRLRRPRVRLARRNRPRIDPWPMVKAQKAGRQHSLAGSA